MAFHFLLSLSFLAVLISCSAENSIVLRGGDAVSTGSVHLGNDTGGVPIQDSVSANYKARYTVGETIVGVSNSQNYSATIGARSSQ